MRARSIPALMIALVFYSTACLSNPMLKTESDAARIHMLERALAPETAEDAANLFALANKNRNGAVQFMLFSQALKEKYKEAWPSWVSGTSSPWITSYTIKKTVEKSNVWQFEITYQWATSSGPFNPPLVQTIQIEPVPENSDSSQQFLITSLEEKPWIRR